MRDFEVNDPPDPQLEIDRMVDGELNDQAQRQLLASLDDTADGWRRLALAFVEARTLKQELGAWVAADRPQPAPPANAQAPTRRIGTGLFALAMACSFLLAFGVAIVWRGALGPTTPSDLESASPTAQNQVPQHRALVVPESPIERLPITQSPTPVESVARNQKDRSPGDATAAQTARHPSPAGDETRRTIEVPVVTVGGSGPPPLANERSALPNHVLEYLQRNGYHVELHKDFRTVPLPDGRRLVIPIEQVDVQFKEALPYQ